MSEPITSAEFRGSATLWFGVLAGPAAWSAQLVLGAELPEFLCSPGATGTTVAGVGIRGALALLSALLVLLTVAGWLASYRCLRRTRRADETTGRRAGWMALSGLLVNSMFLLIIVPGFLPTWVLSDCGRSL